eukprot:Gb_17606 [translate_table: standard]
MDTEPEELQFLGSFGILREAYKIMRSCSRILGALTLTLILPLSFIILGHTLVSEPLFHKIHENEIDFEMQAGSPDGDRTLKKISTEWTLVLVFEAAYLVFLCAFSLLSTAAVVYTVACMYTVKDMSYGKVMSVVPKVWKRLMITFLWFFVLLVVYNTALGSVLFLLVLMVGVDNLQSAPFIIGLTVVLFLFLTAYVYVSMVWHLASVISVLEEKYGMGAMQKSKDLIKGKRLPALVLIMLYFILCGLIGGMFRVGVVHGFMHGVGTAYRFVYGTILVVGLCFVNLMGLLTQSVFYFVCKSYHHESIDKGSLSDHLEEYLGEYVPLKSSNIQLENLRV